MPHWVTLGRRGMGLSACQRYLRLQFTALLYCRARSSILQSGGRSCLHPPHFIPVSWNKSHEYAIRIQSHICDKYKEKVMSVMSRVNVGLLVSGLSTPINGSLCCSRSRLIQAVHPVSDARLAVPI
ncbi:hypothetical protein BDV10DRAFT_167861 [Aspergillus recurvatus]